MRLVMPSPSMDLRIFTAIISSPARHADVTFDIAHAPQQQESLENSAFDVPSREGVMLTDQTGNANADDCVR